LGLGDLYDRSFGFYCVWYIAVWFDPSGREWIVMDNVDNNVRYLIELENREHAYVKQRFDDLDKRLEHQDKIRTLQTVTIILTMTTSLFLIGLGVFSV